MSKYRICRRCVMDTSDPTITLMKTDIPITTGCVKKNGT